MKIAILALGLFSFLVTSSMARLPKKCSENCVTPYGTLLGISKNGANAYSNCSSDCVNRERNTESGTYTGLKWQCVEYARRWLFTEHRVVFGDVPYAYNIWNDISYYQSPSNIKKKRKITVKNYSNGSINDFKVGDLLIYNMDYKDTGHVAVIVAVSSDFIRVAEENYENKKWVEDYARQIPIYKNELGKFVVKDEHVYGIKRMIFPKNEVN